nr:MAG: DNA polymerase [Herpesviridae sp.]
MDNISFFNPYLRKTNEAVKGVKRSHLQILPKGIVKDGEYGLIKNMCSSEPRFFHNKCQYIIKSDMLWPTIDTNSFKRVDRVKFHTYDSVETIMYTDSIEYVPAPLRHHIIPCGIVIHLFGKTIDNEKICVNVFGQKTYFYCIYENEFALNEKIQMLLSEAGNGEQCLFNIQPAEKYSIYGFSNKKIKNLYKVIFNNFRVSKQIVIALQKNGVITYETDVDSLTRFFIDNDYPTFGWFYIDKYYINEINKISNVSIEINCTVENLKIFDDNRWPKYDCLSFDIECMSHHGGFPDPTVTEDLIIQIAAICHNTQNDECSVHLFTLGSIDEIPGVNLYEFTCEFDLICGFLQFFKVYSPEFLSGYNINIFDLNYIHLRATNLYHIKIGSYTKTRNGKFYTYSVRDKTFHLNNNIKVFITGVICIDMYPVCANKLSAPNYKLNTVAEICLNKKKDDLSYKEIPKEFIRNSSGRAKVGKYCVQDAMLVKDLFNKFNYHFEMSAIAILAFIPIRKAIFDGQQKRVFSCLLHESKNRDMIIPSNLNLNSADQKESYMGATVMDPLVGYYNSPVLVFDFASLYPSIMMANNLCYSTLLLDSAEMTSLKSCDIFVVNVNGACHRFVKENVKKSLLSELLQKWLSERKHVKSLMKQCSDPVTKLILDKRQFAIKVVCNAFYGFTGTANGLLPCLAIASSITCIGRQMLQQTTNYIHEFLCSKDFLMEHFDLKDQDFLDSPRMKVIYGDTDSVFVLVKNIDDQIIKQISPKIAEHISSKLFKHPVKLEFEKMFRPLMMICKKRYIGKMDGSSDLVMKGVDLIRKTSCTFVKMVIKEIIDLLFWDEDVSKAAVEMSLMTIEDIKSNGIPYGMQKIIWKLCEARDKLFLNCVDVDDLVLSSVLSKDVSDYKQPNLPHLHVIKRLASRKEEIPAIGDRVSYVLIASESENCKQIPNYELAEDPNYVKENEIPIYAAKYFEHIIKGVSNALSPIFPICDNVKKERFLLSMMPNKVYINEKFKDIVEIL